MKTFHPFRVQSVTQIFLKHVYVCDTHSNQVSQIQYSQFFIEIFWGHPHHPSYERKIESCV